ncbi:HAD-IA family hydrolase [Aurantimonas sp. VKM B-3413]|uniref:HAD-IA family hydrolase n=1 Tax=Aurantimonas sp. VKM B-3413 TaxID=2779401 RepID=UPI001E2F102D|nr:HAD-IA family hydrolase [Aurantimonas sp. VKM B-3413]MCB8837124.1 HAD-IA family hydrolase [Aurantimonas sp. VKM B-3413]
MNTSETEKPAPVAVFDLDGTLVDTAPDLSASLDHCLLAAGLSPVSLGLVRPHAGHGARVMLTEAYRRNGRDISGSEMEEQVARFLDYYAANIAVASRPFAGVERAMDRLADAGFILAVCTNKLETLANQLLGELRLRARFSAVCGPDTVPFRKPHPSHVTETLARAGGTVGAAVMIGDTAADIDAASAAGIASILVDFGYAPDAEARRRADRIIADYDLLDADLASSLIAARRGSNRVYRPALPSSDSRASD